MKGMREDKYDLVFDGPHFVSWRVSELNHTPLVKLPGQLSFVVIARKDNPKVMTLDDLAGYPICGHAPPNLATLTMQDQFSHNPARQPHIKVVRGFKNVYKNTLDKKCEAGVMPDKIYRKLDKKDAEKSTDVLFRSAGIPHQAISASPKLAQELRAKVQEALLSEEGKTATNGLRSRFAGGKEMVTTDSAEYQGFGYLLGDFWGFEIKESSSAESEFPSEMVSASPTRLAIRN
jgi:hypothetical protein